jgi:hypothetical protein
MTKGHKFSIGFMIIGCLLLTQLAAWAQQPKPGGTLRVAWEADITGLGPYISPGVTTLPFLQAHRTYVRGYENLHGHKVRFETTWMDK